MEWQPIETYDTLGLKPRRAVFYVKATKPPRPGGYSLPEAVVLERRYGIREVTHWCELPPLPKEPA